jgi:hypothetical protein
LKSAFGWTSLSKESLKRADTQLQGDTEGVRDEVGFLALHQAYADRFFPGTSVLQTRLRYTLFVPWLYQRLIDRGETRRIGAALEREEVALAGRLKVFGLEGVIGGRSHPKPTSQPAAMVYWTALGTWRILRRHPGGTWPDRASVHRALGRGSTAQRLHDDDHQLLEESQPIFAGIPPPPTEWNDLKERLDFVLPAREVTFLRARLLAVQRPGAEDRQSLLSRLVDSRLYPKSELWDAQVIKAADPEDRAALRRAKQAAGLSAIGRGVYAALVETIRDRYDGVKTESLHGPHLQVVTELHRDEALALDVDAVRHDAPNGVSESILSVLRETQSWLRRKNTPIENLHRVYEQAESRRKGRRARLTDTIAGRERRAEWTPEEHPRASPLHYRWANVRRLLLDLRGPT